MTELTVTVVDDDFRVAGLHAEIVGRAPGFRVGAVCPTLARVREEIRSGTTDLLLLDLHLPDGSGLDLLRESTIDAFVLSAAAETRSVMTALSCGALTVLLKPFAAEVLLERLEAYRRYRRILDRTEVLTQAEIDQAVRTLHAGTSGHRPKEHSSLTERAVIQAVATATAPMSATEVADRVGISRATAQRYLALLSQEGRLETQLRYGSTGRPEHLFTAH